MSPWKPLAAVLPDAGTCLGSDMAAAAITVARSTRRVHMSASFANDDLAITLARRPAAGHQPIP